MQIKKLIRKNNINLFIDFLNSRYPDAKCQLNYKDKYQLLIMTMLSARVKDIAVNKVSAKLFNRYKDIHSLSKANLNDVIDIIKPLGMSKSKANNTIEIARFLDQNEYPDNKVDLMKLPGVGNKVANVIMAEVFNKKYIAVDTHVHRILTRLNIINEKDKYEVIERKINNTFKVNNYKLLNHQLIEFGREICKSNKPKCDICPFRCSYKN